MQELFIPEEPTGKKERHWELVQCIERANEGNHNSQLTAHTISMRQKKK